LIATKIVVLTFGLVEPRVATAWPKRAMTLTSTTARAGQAGMFSREQLPAPRRLNSAVDSSVSNWTQDLMRKFYPAAVGDAASAGQTKSHKHSLRNARTDSPGRLGLAPTAAVHVSVPSRVAAVIHRKQRGCAHVQAQERLTDYFVIRRHNDDVLSRSADVAQAALQPDTGIDRG